MQEVGRFAMAENIRKLGRVKMVQVQPSGLIIERPSGSFYDVSRIIASSFHALMRMD
jgi:hypothetical protein